MIVFLPYCQIYIQNLTKFDKKRFTILSIAYINGTIKSVNRHFGGQIYVCNPKNPAEKNLLSLYGKFFLYVVMKFLPGFKMEDNVFFVGDACNKLKGI